MVSLGPVEVETRTYGDEDRRVFFDPIGSLDLVDCTYRSAEELDAMEERDEPGWWKVENQLAPDSRPPTYGGNFEFNWRGYRIAVTLWWAWAYRLGTRLNEVLLAREERRSAV
jgi:hypothetical protein